MNLKNKFDFKSIKFKLWITFIGFALILIAMIWTLQIFFLNNYYEEMKINETTKIANQIKNDYDVTSDLSELGENIQRYSQSNDIFIKVETGSGSIVISPDNYAHSRSFLYTMEIQQLRSNLLNSSLDRVSVITPSGDNTRMLSYACYLNKKVDGETVSENLSGSYILYIFSPLYPVESTVAILRNQLFYITVIAAGLALCLALFLANRISKPIKDITASAAEMGKGNYGVNFRGGHYSEITNLADTLTTASRELEKTDMYQKDLIANVSHDLRTPLTMIKSYAEMVRDLSGDNPKKRSAHLNVIIEEADRLNVLVNDMLNMSRMQSRKIVLEKSPFSLKETLETLLFSYEILAEQEGYSFICNCSRDFIINGDQAKIKQVFSNLMNNAVKYCGEDKQVIISIKKIGRKVRCEITDHGAGIAPDEVNHVWERYYKSSTHHVRPTDGSGLGLSIVKEILTLHKADYGVESKLGEGSTFWFEMNILKEKK